MHRHPRSICTLKIYLCTLLGFFSISSSTFAQIPAFSNDVIDLNQAPRQFKRNVIDFHPLSDGSVSFRMDFDETDAQYLLRDRRLDTLVYPSLINGRVIGEYGNGLLYWTSAGGFPTQTYAIDRTTLDTTLLFTSYNPSTVAHRFADGRTLITSDSFYVIGAQPTETQALLPNDQADRFVESTTFGDRFVFSDFRRTVITDGTVAGTDTLITERGEFNFGRSHEYNGRLFIPTASAGLYVSDGTASGTGLLVDESNTTSSLSSDILAATLTAMDSAMIYLGYSQRGPQMVASDGTRVGTRSLGTIHNSSFAASRRWAVYRAGPNGRELWRTDGTEANTELLVDFRDRNVTFDGWRPEKAGELADGTLYFETNEAGKSLWALSAEGVLTEIAISTTTFGQGPEIFTTANQLFAYYRHDFSGLFTHEPGEPNLTLVAEIASPGGYTLLDQGILLRGETAGFDPQPISVLHYDGRTTIYPQHVGMNVSTSRPTSGTLSLAQNSDVLTGVSYDTDLGEAVIEIHLPTGTYTTIADIYPYTLDSEVYNLRASTGAAFFQQGAALYGTTDGIQYDSVGQLSQSYDAVSIPGQKTTLYYSSNDWLLSDGSPAGTLILPDAGAALRTDVIAHESDFYYLTLQDTEQSRSTLSINRRSGVDGRRTIIREFVAARNVLRQGRYSLASSGGQVFFTAYTDAGGWEIWTTDGTDAGTLPLVSYTRFSDGHSAFGLKGGNGYVSFFTSPRGFRSVGGREYILWEGDNELQAFPTDQNRGEPNYVRYGDMVYYTIDGRLHRLPRNATEPDTLLDPTFGYVYHPYKLAGGQMLLMFSATGSQDQSLIRYELSTGDTTVVIDALKGNFGHRPPPYVVRDSIALVVRAWGGSSSFYDEVRLVNLNNGSSVLAQSEGGLSDVRGIASDGKRFLYIDETFTYGREVYVVNFTSEGAVSAPELAGATGLPITIYPNPATEAFRVDAPPNRQLRYWLVSSGGQIVRVGIADTSVSIPTVDLPTGIYFFRVVDPTTRQVTVRRIAIKR